MTLWRRESAPTMATGGECPCIACMRRQERSVCRLCGRVTRRRAARCAEVCALQSCGMSSAGTGITLADSFRKG